MKNCPFLVLLRKDFSLFINRRQFVFFLVVLFFSTVISLISGHVDYNHRAESYSTWREAQANTLNSLKMAWSLRGPGYTQSIEPSPLSIIVYGAEDLISSSFETREWTKQFFGNLQYNPFLSPFVSRFDFAMLIIILLPVLLIFLLADFCRDELVQKTFMNCQIFGISNLQFLSSKLIASFVPVVLSLSLLIGIGFLSVYLVGKPIEGLFIRYVLFCMFAAMYSLFWISIFLMAQISIRHSLKSMAVGMAAWMIVVFVLPAVHMSSQLGHQGEGSMALYYNEKKKIYYRLAESYNYFETIADKKDIDPFAAYSDFFSKIEEAMIDCKECTLPAPNEITTFESGVRNSPTAMLTPTFITMLSLSDLTTSGLLDYVNFRQVMFEYFKYFKSVWTRPEVLAWLRSYSETAPVEALQKLNLQHKRSPLNLTLSNIKPLALVALINALFALAIYYVVSLRALRTIGDRQ